MTHTEAQRRLRDHAGDEVEAAWFLADEIWGDVGRYSVHAALVMLRRALGGEAPSFDWLVAELRARKAA